jgi:hypothetical protein
VVAAARARVGLDRSLPEQYLVYVGNLLTGDFARRCAPSRSRLDLLQRLPATLELVVAAMLVGSLVGDARRSRPLSRSSGRSLRPLVRPHRFLCRYSGRA